MGLREANEEFWKETPVIELRSDMVAFAGDWHGNTMWAAKCISAVTRLKGYDGTDVNAILHVGDFGVWQGDGGWNYIRFIQQYLKAADVLLLVTPGNHENWDMIDNAELEDRGNGVGPAWWISANIAILPRNTTFRFRNPAWEEGVDRRVLSLGGAPSIDFEHRREGHSWWPNEMIEDHHVEEAKKAKFADIMVAHDSPGGRRWTGAVQRICEGNPMGWSKEALAYAKVGRDRMTKAVNLVDPITFVHGHYHVFDYKLHSDTPYIRTVALDCDNAKFNLILINVLTLQDAEILI